MGNYYFQLIQKSKGNQCYLNNLNNGHTIFANRIIHIVRPKRSIFWLTLLPEFQSKEKGNIKRNEYYDRCVLTIYGRMLVTEWVWATLGHVRILQFIRLDQGADKANIPSGLSLLHHPGFCLTGQTSKPHTSGTHGAYLF